MTERLDRSVWRLAWVIVFGAFAVVLARGMPAGAESAFHTTFRWLAAASVLSLLSATALWLALRSTIVMESDIQSADR